MKDIKCSTLMIWTKDTQPLEKKFPVIYFFIVDIEELTDVEVKYRFFDHILY
jgi:hypothetical protein